MIYLSGNLTTVRQKLFIKILKYIFSINSILFSYLNKYMKFSFDYSIKNLKKIVFKIPSILDFSINEAMSTYNHEKFKKIIRLNQSKYNSNFWVYLFSEFVKKESAKHPNQQFSTFFIEMYNFFVFRNFIQNKYEKTLFLVEFKKHNLYKNHIDISKHIQKTLFIPKKFNLPPHLYWWSKNNLLIDDRFLNYFPSFNWRLIDTRNIQFPDYSDYLVNIEYYTKENWEDFCKYLIPKNNKLIRKEISQIIVNTNSVEPIFLTIIKKIGDLNLKENKILEILKNINKISPIKEYNFKALYFFLSQCDAVEDIFNHNDVSLCFDILLKNETELGLLIKTFNSIKRKIPNFNFKFKHKNFYSLYSYFFKFSISLNGENIPIHQERIYYLKKYKFNNLKFVIPKNSFELQQLGLIFKNCIQDIEYQTNINQNEFFIFALIDESANKPVYCVQMSIEGRILEIKGKHNQAVSWHISSELEYFINSVGEKNPN